MTPPSPAYDYSEDALEQAALGLLNELGWETANLYSEWSGGASSEGRGIDHEVVLTSRLRTALAKLNPTLSSDAIEQAVEELKRDRSKLIQVNANQEIYILLRDGVKVEVPDDRGGTTTETVRLIDWRNPENNEFFMASQFWVRGELYSRRCDLVGFVNGIPLLFLELKASHNTLKASYDGNLTDYRNAIPQLFAYNGFVVLSNGSQTVMGSTYAPWEHFSEWKRINDEGETGVVSLETVIRGTATPERLLDIVENFTLFEEAKGGRIKMIAKNHQYLGVNKAIAKLGDVRQRPKDQAGQLGVFWHTQGSGKSLSMVFFTQKTLRTIPGNWTFVIVTDREELDEQIYKTFAATGAVTEDEAHATSGANLKQLLTEDHRYVFTLIHKFGTNQGEAYPKLSDRQDVIVITDEAHRTQYDTLAFNMRSALPHAAFLGFTGTPLIDGEEKKTRDVFGGYISVYDFGQSIEDGATVPLYYENRKPELQLTNDDLSKDMDKLLEEAELDADQERKVQRVFAREYHLISRDERLEAIAEDLVQHFTGRGHQGKAMMICIDKATAVRMYDKVQNYWQAHLTKLKGELTSASDEDREALEATIKRMEEADMAVVVSQAQNEETELAKKGLNIRPHRKRMIEEELDEKFKDPNDPLRLVFVCAMWTTGFDVPSCSTIYLDKPMKNHTLMQTIARANRRDAGKAAGLIVDYVGVFGKLQKALAIYGGTIGEDDGGQPIKDKSELVEYLKHLVAQTLTFLTKHGIEPEKIKEAEGFQKIALLDDAVEKLLGSEETKRSYFSMAASVSRVYKAILPDPVASEITADAVLISVLAQKMKSLAPPVDISHVMEQVEDLLDRSVAPVPYLIHETPDEKLFDLSQIDFEKLKEKFAQGRKRTEAEKLRSLLNQKMVEMAKLNPTRSDFLERFERLIEKYNSASLNIEEFFEELINLTQDLSEEEQRGIREGLTEEELALFDILTKPEPELTEKERAEVKKTCKSLLETLKAEKLVLDWHNKPQARGAVKQAIEVVLDQGLPEAYDEDIYETKCNAAFNHIFSAYSGGGESIYASVQS
ncbi:type I restriction endonuclease subunit R [Fodinicurvata fenggangensis]|uniref:type I restriction endonuclease subunit R n=1 Tax=Fodinicurvata fenggangensis TaxID=1121830 RepID=UPI000478D06F|nr:type I restriction endonuclease subunit R [Fodinicurvata fenggangensis]